FEDFSDNSINEVNAADSPVPVVGQISTNSTNTFSAAGPSNVVNWKTLLILLMNIGAEADFNNLETSITVSPIPTTKVHKDHLVTQIIGDLASATQTKSMTKVAKDQGFEDPDYPDKIYKVIKAYMDYIKVLELGLCKAFEKLIKDKFQMISMRELTFFLGLQVKQKQNGIFISQDKYVAEILRKFGLTDGKSVGTLIDTEKTLPKDPDVTPKASHLHAAKMIFRYLKGKPHLGLWYPKDLPFNLVAYLDSDYAGASLDRKSTTKGCQFLGCRLISWQCKKQTVVATSSTEAEKLQTEAQVRKNMMIYLRNVAGFKMDYFKGMTYEDIRPIFEKKFNSNVAFLQKTKEQIEEEDSRALKRLSKSQEDKVAKKQKLDEEVAELKRHLQIVPNDEDDVYTEATPLARK
nr:hypothetical protein [Tanacetum cinerariifolium]